MGDRYVATSATPGTDVDGSSGGGGGGGGGGAALSPDDVAAALGAATPMQRAAILAGLFPTTVFDGSSPAGWTSVPGSGVATIAGTFALSMALLAPGVVDHFVGPGSQHPRHYRDVVALLGTTGDWSVTVRVASLLGGATGDRICLALNDAAETGGVILSVWPDGQVALVTDWSNAPEVVTGVGVCPVDGTGYLGMRSRGGNITAAFGTGTPTELPSAWSTLETGTARVRVPLTRLTLFAASPSGYAVDGAFDDVRVRSGL